MPIKANGLIVDPLMPICIFCKNLLEGGDGMKCRAYPNGIPNLIVESVQDHRFHVEGDNGIKFESTGQDGTDLANEYFGELPS